MAQSKGGGRRISPRAELVFESLLPCASQLHPRHAGSFRRQLIYRHFRRPCRFRFLMITSGGRFTALHRPQLPPGSCPASSPVHPKTTCRKPPSIDAWQGRSEAVALSVADIDSREPTILVRAARGTSNVWFRSPPSCSRKCGLGGGRNAARGGSFQASCRIGLRPGNGG